MQIDEYSSNFDDLITFFQNDLISIRTGRANPALVENINVEAYNVATPLMQLASISSPDPKTIVIQPWDKGVLKDIEKAIQSSDINLSPIVDKEVIRLSMPALTEENRIELVKLLSQKAEITKVNVRKQREKIKHEIQMQHEAGEVSEDEKFKLMKDLEILTKKYNDKIKEISETKEKEIMTV